MPKYSYIFQQLDTNGDQSVDMKEAQKGQTHPTRKENRQMLFQICDKNKDGRLEADEFYCYEDPLPETLGAYHAYSLLQIEKALKQKASSGAAHVIDQRLSHDEVSQALGFGKANKVGLFSPKLTVTHASVMTRIPMGPCSAACDSSAGELPSGAVSGMTDWCWCPAA